MDPEPESDAVAPGPAPDRVKAEPGAVTAKPVPESDAGASEKSNDDFEFRGAWNSFLAVPVVSRTFIDSTILKFIMSASHPLRLSPRVTS